MTGPEELEDPEAGKVYKGFGVLSVLKIRATGCGIIESIRMNQL